MASVPPIMIDFEDRLETGRLLLRPALPGDGAEVHAAMQESLEQLKPWMIWANSGQSAADTEATVRRSHARFLERTDFRYHGYSKETGELVICCGLHGPDWEVRQFEVGYWLRTKYTGQGLATEAVRALEKLAIDTFGANRLELRCDGENVRSIATAKRLGFTLEGTLRRHEWNADRTSLRDTRVFSKIRGIEF